MRFWLAVPAICLLSACGSNGDDDVDQVPGDNVVVEEPETGANSITLTNASGETVGTVELTEEPSGVTLALQVNGLEAGTHAVHLHETGACTAPDFTSAGGHWNPGNAQHGRDNPEGPHLGDLSNMDVAEDGTGSSNWMVSGASISGAEPSMSDADGTAIVIHAGADDYQTDPAGDAGSRVACGIIAAPRS